MKPRLSWPLLVRKVSGHSMLPVLPPGTYILGLRWYGKLKSGKVVVVEREGREVIKRIQDIGNDGLFVVGDHAEASTDSRQYGAIPEAWVKAAVLWPRTTMLRQTGN